MSNINSTQLIDRGSDTLLNLIAVAIGNRLDYSVPKETYWESIIQSSYTQGVAGVLYDGFQKLYGLHPDEFFSLDKEKKAIKRDWFGSVLSMEASFENHMRVVKDLSVFYESNGIKMLLLKGIGLSVYYPIPSHRPTGDIDIYLYGQQKEGDKLISSQKGIKIKTSSEHHTVFSFDGITVENHYDFINTKIRRSGKTFDSLLKELVGEPSKLVYDSILVPNPQFNLLFLMKHMSGHFASEGITLRHILDWALFINTEFIHLDWDSFYSICQSYNTDRFISAINAICIDYLGFKPELFPIKYRDYVLEGRILNEILAYKQEKRPRGFVLETLFRLNKWRKTRWKQRICYSDSAISSFVTSVVSNVIKTKCE